MTNGDGHKLTDHTDLAWNTAKNRQDEAEAPGDEIQEHHCSLLVTLLQSVSHDDLNFIVDTFRLRYYQTEKHNRSNLLMHCQCNCYGFGTIL